MKDVERLMDKAILCWKMGRQLPLDLHVALIEAGIDVDALENSVDLN